MALIDLTNKKFGRLTVLERDNSKPKGHGKPVYWLCQCDCGNVKSVKACHLKDGSIQSCGCLHREKVSKQFSKDISNKKYDHLTAIQPLYVNDHGETIWLCRCDCGNLCEKSIGQLTDKRRIKSCGHVHIKSYAEEEIRKILEENNIFYKREFTFPDLKGNSNKLRFDFAVFDKKETLVYLIEYNGYFHYYTNETYGGEERLQKQQEYDKKKQDYCDKNNYCLIVLNNFNQITKENIIKEDLLCLDI